MPDARVLVGIAAIIGVLVLGIVLFIVERRHSGRGLRRGPERLPLFGTEKLAIRTQDGYEEIEEVAHLPVARPTPNRAMMSAQQNGGGRLRSAPTMARPEIARSRPPYGDGRRESPAQSTPPAASQSSEFAQRAPSVRPAPSVPATATQEYTSPTAVRANGSSPSAADTNGAAAVDSALVEGETLRFTLPVDDTVEFLRGYLEVVAGPDAGQEIRFVRTPGEQNVEVTFGRSEGAPNRHVQILARTVSRRHAIMSLIDDHWQLTNLSSTNPAILNGRVLAGDEVAPLLVEGDRIEMGEVVFVYHDA